MGFLLNIEKIYQNLAKNQLKVLPHSPFSKIGMSTLLHKVRLKELSDLISDPDIKKSVEFYSKHHEELGDTQNIYKLMFTFQCLKQTEKLEGDIIELGTYKGGNTIMMAYYLKQIKSKKNIFGCDTFNGIPDPDEFVRNELGQGLFSNTSLDSVSQKVKKFKMDDKIDLIQGKFQDSLSKIQDSKFSLIFLDCCIYSAAKFGIEFAYPRLVNDGVMISQCYGVRKPSDNNDLGVSPWGETTAVDEFLKDKIENVMIDSMPYIQKCRERPNITNSMPKDQFSTYSNQLK